MTRWLPLVALLCLAAAPAAGALPPVVEKALDAASHKAAYQLLEAEAQTVTDPKALAWIVLYAGEARRLAGDLSAARRHFERVASEFPSSGARDPAKVGLAVVDANGKAGGNTLATLELVGDAGVPDTLNADRWLLVAAAKAREGGDPAAVEALVAKARRYAEADRDVARRVDRQATPLLARAAAEAVEQAVADDVAAIGTLRDALGRRDWAAARAAAEDFLLRFPDSALRREAEYGLRRADLARAPDPKKVAVLLPLSGAYAPPGKNLRAAIEMANDRAATHATLTFHDTKGDPEQCVRLIEKAVLEEGASVVVGPLLRDEAKRCAPAAQALRVPLVALTSSDEAAAAGDLVFRPFPTVEEQIEALLDEVYDRRVLHRYAVLHPATAYGENAAAAFSRAVTARGGTVPVTLPYPADTNDFRTVARALEKDGPPAQRVDAVFIPDAYQRVALIASALAFEEISVGRFRPHGGADPLVLVGLNGWNNDDLARRGGQYVLDSVFVDAFDPRSNRPEVQRFVADWAAAGRAPPSVVEAVGFDTMLLVDAAIGRGGDVADALRAVTLPEPGLAGTTGFGADGVVDREFRLLTVTRAGIVPTDQAWASEGAPPP